MSLTLDMCTPGTTEPYGALLSPREQSTQEYLEKASNPLTPGQLHIRALDDAVLQAEFYVSLILYYRSSESQEAWLGHHDGFNISFSNFIWEEQRCAHGRHGGDRT